MKNVSLKSPLSCNIVSKSLKLSSWCWFLSSVNSIYPLFSAHFGGEIASKDLDAIPKSPNSVGGLEGRQDRRLQTSTVFLTKNNTHLSAHSGSTVILACTVNEESKFEMVSP